ncbi:MAG: hypothetical protein IKG25_05435 [Mogibacterium sp.]|nr:hypothetical protein [Mogibacterium sp.]
MTANIKVKNWKVDQIIDEAHKYHLAICRVNNEDGTYTLHLDQPVLKETEKAVYVSLDAETYGENARSFRTWIPKSCIVA